MSYQVLARKWRPKSFETLVGQPHVVRALTNALEQQRLHHAYLFTGTRGVGKTTLARILAKSLNCETGITAKPCGICNACISIDEDRFLDYFEINAASTRGIDDVRSLLEQATYAPTIGRFKVYMLDEVHQFTKDAFNALLKMLEEPPAHVKFILGTTDPQKVPVTVLSRCLQFNLRQMASPTIAEYLQNVLGQESIAFEPAAINLISRAAAGSMRDALSLTDQAIAYGNQTVNEAEVRSMLGAIDQSYLFEIIQALINGDGAALIEKAQQMQARSISFEAALNDLANLLHQIAIAQTVPSSIAADLPERASLLDLAQKLSVETLQLYYQIALLGRRDISLAPDEYAGFTMSLLRMLAFAPSEKLANSTEKTAAPAPKKTPVSNENSSIVQSDAPRLEHSGAGPGVNIHAAPTPMENPRGNEARENTPILFDGNWRNLVEGNLKLGLARTLAQNCELINFDENSMTLRVAESQKHLASATYQDKLSSAINEYFGRRIKLNIEISGEANTPAKQKSVEKAVEQSGAEAAIMNDSFVQALMQDFDAQIIPNTIKPI